MNKSHLLCIIAIFFFSTNELVGKLIDSSVSPIAITCYRFFIGSILLAFPILKNRQKYRNLLSYEHFISISVIGILNVCVSMYMLQLGIYYGHAGLAAVIISSNPIFVGIFASFILKERLTFKNIICWAFGLSGLSMVIFGQFSNPGISKNIYLGIIFSILASVTFALYTVLSKKQIRKSDSMFFNSISFMSGSIVLFILGLVSGQNMSLSFHFSDLIGVLYLGIFVTGVAYIAFFEGLKKIYAATGSSFFLLKPVFASILTYIFLKEQLTIIQIAGVVIVILSLFFQSYKFTRIKSLLDS